MNEWINEWLMNEWMKNTCKLKNEWNNQMNAWICKLISDGQMNVKKL